jgi:hypothetical protein
MSVVFTQLPNLFEAQKIPLEPSPEYEKTAVKRTDNTEKAIHGLRFCCGVFVVFVLCKIYSAWKEAMLLTLESSYPLTFSGHRPLGSKTLQQRPLPCIKYSPEQRFAQPTNEDNNNNNNNNNNK